MWSLAPPLYLKEYLYYAVSGCKVADEAGPVEGDVAAPRAVVGNILSQQRRHLVLEQVVNHAINQSIYQSINRSFTEDWLTEWHSVNQQTNELFIKLAYPSVPK